MTTDTIKWRVGWTLVEMKPHFDESSITFYTHLILTFPVSRQKGSARFYLRDHCVGLHLFDEGKLLTHPTRLNWSKFNKENITTCQWKPLPFLKSIKNNQFLFILKQTHSQVKPLLLSADNAVGIDIFLAYTKESAISRLHISVRNNTVSDFISVRQFNKRDAIVSMKYNGARKCEKSLTVMIILIVGLRTIGVRRSYYFMSVY